MSTKTVILKFRPRNFSLKKGISGVKRPQPVPKVHPPPPGAQPPGRGPNPGNPPMPPPPPPPPGPQSGAIGAKKRSTPNKLDRSAPSPPNASVLTSALPAVPAGLPPGPAVAKTAPGPLALVNALPRCSTPPPPPPPTGPQSGAIGAKKRSTPNKLDRSAPSPPNASVLTSALPASPGHLPSGPAVAKTAPGPLALVNASPRCSTPPPPTGLDRSAPSPPNASVPSSALPAVPADLPSSGPAVAKDGAVASQRGPGQRIAAAAAADRPGRRARGEERIDRSHPIGSIGAKCAQRECSIQCFARGPGRLAVGTGRRLRRRRAGAQGRRRRRCQPRSAQSQGDRPQELDRSAMRTPRAKKKARTKSTKPPAGPSPLSSLRWSHPTFTPHQFRRTCTDTFFPSELCYVPESRWSPQSP